jgi:MYXO-CTERM domain-containing protein
MVCHTETWESCGGSASSSCDEEGNCTAVEVTEDCETGSNSQCIYRWQAGCEVDADCGEGFSCESYEVGCDCAASSDAEERPAIDLPADADADGGTAETDQAEADQAEADQAEAAEEQQQDPAAEKPAPGCECAEPQKVNYCEPKRVECDSEADCPDAWTCESQGRVSCGGEVDSAQAPPDAPEGFAPSEGEQSDGAEGDTEVPPADDTGEKPAEDPCQPVESPKLCMPPGSYGDIATDGASGGTDVPREDSASDPKGEVDNGGSGEAIDEAGSVDGSEEPKPSDTEGQIDEDKTQESEEPSEEPKAEDGGVEAEDAKDESDDAASSDDAGGCSVQPGSAPEGSLSWLSALFGLALLRRRKS